MWFAWIPVVLYFYFQIQELGGKDALLAHYAMQLTFLTLASISLASVAFHQERRELWSFWSRLATAMALWCLASVMEATEVLLQQPRFGTVADGSWVGGYVVLLAGLFAGTKVFEGWQSKQATRAGVTWLIIACAIGLIIRFAAMPVVDRPLVLLLGYVYYASDMTIVFLALICALGNKAGDMKPALKMIFVACALFYAFDVIVIMRHLTGPLDQWSAVGDSLGYFLLYRAGQVVKERVATG